MATSQAAQDRILKNVSWVLVIAGSLETFSWIMSQIAHWQEIPVGALNLLAVAAGLALFFGRTKTSFPIAVAAGFFSGFLSTLVVTYFFEEPVDLIWVKLRLQPLPTVLAFVSLLVDASIACWTYIQLRRPEFREAQAAIGRRPTSLWWMLLIGCAVAAAASLAPLSFAGSSEVIRAKERAKELYGDRYHYYVSGFIRPPGQAHNNIRDVREFKVTAYNENEIVIVRVSLNP